MAFSMAGGGPSRPEINVTPLIDVLLVLIIVFMVVVAIRKIADKRGSHRQHQPRCVWIGKSRNQQFEQHHSRDVADDIAEDSYSNRWRDRRPICSHRLSLLMSGNARPQTAPGCF